jgi:hypothetical protein
MDKIIIGHTDYSRRQIEAGGVVFIGTSPNKLLELIEAYESVGYEVKFETSLLRKIFGLGIYKVIAQKQSPITPKQD